MTLTSSRHSVADQSLDAHIALLLSLRTQTLEMADDVREADGHLSSEFDKVRALVENRLAYALLRRKLGWEATDAGDLVYERLPSGDSAWLRREVR